MALTQDGYRPRLIDDFIRDYLTVFGALVVEGPKWCGKTWTSLNHAESVFSVADPANNYANRMRALYDPKGVLEGTEPRLLDEWQEAPGLWDAVRFNVDSERRKGRYILTGSTKPEAAPGTGADGSPAAPLHSGTGRIAHLAMRTMSLYESGHSTGEVSLKSLIKGEDIPPASARFTLESLIDVLVAGGWPENLNVPQRLAGLLPRQYLLNTANVDISQFDTVRRNSAKVLALLASLARTTGSAASSKTLSADIALHENATEASPQSVLSYLNLLRRLFVIEELPGWEPALRSPLRLRTTPRRYLTDPSLAVAGLQANHQSLLEDRKTLGFVFENLVIRDLLIYAQAHDAQVQYYLDDAQLDCDAVLNFGAERWAALECKLGSDQEGEAAEKLLRLTRKLETHGVRPPLFLAVLTGLGTTAHKRSDGVYCIPIDVLKP